MSDQMKGPTPRELREIFPHNLRVLSQGAESISALARDIGINRTQFNRYLAGQSHPAPDVLYRICRHFGVDARILHEKIDTEDRRPEQSKDIGNAVTQLLEISSLSAANEQELPSGYYRALTETPAGGDVLQDMVNFVYREANVTRVKAYVPRVLFSGEGAPRVRPGPVSLGVCLGVPDGIAVLSVLSGVQHIAMTRLRTDTFGRKGVYFGRVMVVGREQLQTEPGRRVLFSRLSGFREALDCRRRAGLVKLTALPSDLRGFFE